MKLQIDIHVQDMGFNSLCLSYVEIVYWCVADVRIDETIPSGDYDEGLTQGEHNDRSSDDQGMGKW